MRGWRVIRPQIGANIVAMADDALASGWGPDEPVDDSVLRQFLHNQADATAALAATPLGRSDRTDDVALNDGGGPVPYVNQAVLLRPLTGPDDPVLDTVDRFYAEAAGRPVMLLSVWPVADLSSRGWHPAGHPMFVVRAPGPVTYVPRDGVGVAPVRTTADLGVVERIAIDGYPIPPAQGLPAGSLFAPSLLDSPVGIRVGSVDGVPVSAGAVCTTHGVVNLCFAATLPEARRRGVWSAVMWDRVAAAPELPAVAFTSDDSRPGFLQHGFLPITRFTLLVRGGG